MNRPGELSRLYEEYKRIKDKKQSLDMTRGKPSPVQLDTMQKLLTAVQTNEDCIDGNIDCRNYGVFDGLPKAKMLFSELLDISPDQIVVCGNSSLNIMYDTIAHAMLLGTGKGAKPWCKYEKLSFLCPSPGYDRHFRVTQFFGFNLIYIPMLPTGPDMELIEKIVSEDESVKGMWCIPKYSNPTGYTFSDDTVIRLAKMKTAAKDFRVFWDNAYAVHDLYDTSDNLLNVLEEAYKYGNEDRFLIFASTSKISYSGAGISCFASSADNVKWFKDALKVQTIGHDKINQLRHVKIFPDLKAIKSQMDIHRKILLPKFELVLNCFEKEFSDFSEISWTKPRGGYFISLTVLNNTAKRVVSLAKEAGLLLTSAGSGFPYEIDPNDNNIRIAPSFPSCEELEKALELLVICVKIAYYEAKETK